MSDSLDPTRRWWRRAAFPVAAAAILVALVALFAMRWAADHALSVSRASAAQAARSNHGLLFSELQKFRLLPLVLTEYPDVGAVLQRSDDEAVSRLNSKLELLAQRTNAAVIYVIGRDGRTVAASNWRLPSSFVDQDYGFRPYFQDALRTGAAELFALGTVSGRPGLFIARRIEAGGEPLGVVVVKVEFDAVEAGWARADGETFVTDANGVVIITSRPEWRFRTTRPLDPAIQARVREAVQYGREPLRPLPIEADGEAVRVDGAGRRSFVAAALPTALAGAHVNFLEPLQPARDSAYATAWAILLGASLLAVLMLALLLRAQDKRAMQQQARRALEREVALRTAELREANDNLRTESREREIVDRRYRQAREELAQANRLSSIGQIVAGVAHEINQPVAAIRSFADNGAKLLERERVEEAKENLGLISDLTARIGSITAELRSFARRRTLATGPVRIGTVIDGALLLIGDTLRAGRITLERVGNEDVALLGDRVRLEQILINLLQNAADALAGCEDPAARLSIVRVEEEVVVEVADNGSGIAPEVADELFTPFATARENGLGLGLAIARDIAREFGGELESVPSPLGGAAFRLRLRPA